MPHLKILGIGDLVLCATFEAQKQSEASKLLQQLEAVGSIEFSRRYPRRLLLLLNNPFSE